MKRLLLISIPNPESTHQGETREQRVGEHLEEDDRPVVGLREGAMLRVDQGRITLVGTANARVCRRGCDRTEISPGDVLDLTP